MVVVTPIRTDKVEIDNYISSHFPEEDEEVICVFQDLREAIKRFSKEFSGRKTPFDLSVLRWSIGSLMKNDLLRDEQESIQEEFLANEVVPPEIADVLNMLFADLRNRSWEVDEKMFYEPRRQFNGTFRITMDEDILQAIFLHFIGITWPV